MHNLQVIKPEALYQNGIRRATKYLEDANKATSKDTRIALLKLAIEAIHVSIGVANTNDKNS